MSYTLHRGRTRHRYYLGVLSFLVTTIQFIEDTIGIFLLHFVVITDISYLGEPGMPSNTRNPSSVCMKFSLLSRAGHLPPHEADIDPGHQLVLLHVVHGTEDKRLVLGEHGIDVENPLHDPLLQSDLHLSLVMEAALTIGEERGEVENKWMPLFQNVPRDLVFARCKNETRSFLPWVSP